MKKCVLYDRDCIACGECDLCDFEPGKVCDNCGKCIEIKGHFSSIKIDGIVTANTRQKPSEKFKEKPNAH